MNRIELEEFEDIGGLTPDTCRALERLQMRANVVELGLQFSLRSGPSSPVGRSLCVTVGDNFEDLCKLWSLAVPLGFTPWSRFPVPGTNQEDLFFLGPWQILIDRLCGEGRGHLAWMAVCKASQLDVGGTNQELGAFVQAQLHRVGGNPGNLDGIVGPRTKQALTVLGVSPDLEEASGLLAEMDPPKVTPAESGPWRGHLIGHGLSSISCHGQVAVTRTPTGATLTIEGPGRVIADFAPETES